MKFKVIDEDTFRSFLDSHCQKSFLQTPEIGKLRQKSGWEVHYVAVFGDKKIIAASMLVSRNAHFNQKEFYAPRGFLLDYNDKNLLTFFTNEVKKFIKKNKGYILRIDPYFVNVQRDTNGDIVDGGVDNRKVSNYLAELGYKRAKKEDMEQVGWMYVLDVDGKTEEEILKNMKPNTRNTIRKTLKNGIEIIELEKKDLKEFHKIMVETGKRKNFHVRNLKYFEDMYDLYSPRGEIKYLITKLDLNKHIETLKNEKHQEEKARDSLSDAKYNDGKRKAHNQTILSIEKRIKQAEDIKNKGNDIITLSGSMFILTQPEVIYLSSGNYEEYMFYNSQYLIQWEMIKYAINNGFKRYNFYGITGNFDKNDKDYGIYEFKTGFNGYVEELIGEYHLPISPVYYIMNLIHKIHK
ncbi:MAG: peptidoglycan bridge formation glycyltransferase FemA/FemB family protein [Bacilli bacterium]|nr:peptidoglycan bridge formation glycyltransferase FemA/FemB family protein [Bacilli bacterium]